jgi:hypothetical protein
LNAAIQLREHDALTDVRALADQAFSRAAGAPLIGGNSVRLLKNARENYQAWLDAIGSAKRQIHFESYIIHEDNTGRKFADALIGKAREGVRVRLIYDWVSGFGKTSRRFWNHLRAGGVEVRCYNPPRLDSPFGWLSCDHRQDLSNATEIVLDAKQKVRAPGEPPHPHPVMTSGGGRGGRAATGAVRIGNAVGAAFTGKRMLGPVEARLMTSVGVLFLVLAALFALFPRVLVYPLLIIFAWLGGALLYRSYKLHREGRRKRDAFREQAASRRVIEENVEPKRD